MSTTKKEDFARRDRDAGKWFELQAIWQAEQLEAKEVEAEKLVTCSKKARKAFYDRYKLPKPPKPKPDFNRAQQGIEPKLKKVHLYHSAGIVPHCDAPKYAKRAKTKLRRRDAA